MSTFAPGRWQGAWVWAAGALPSSGRTVVALRASRDLAVVPPVIPTRVHAVSGYVLLVNGTEVSRGPVRANPRRHAYDLVDLAPWLVPGRNELAVLAWAYHQPTPWRHPLPGLGDLPRGAFVLEASLADETWATDVSWRGQVLSGWELTRGEGVLGRGVERLDPAALVDGWSTSRYDGWQPVEERQPFTPGRPGQTRPPSYPLGPVDASSLSRRVGERVELVRQGDAWVSEQGVVAGTVRLSVTGAAGAVVRVQVAERVAERPQPTEHDAVFEIVCTGEPVAVETLDSYGLAGLVVSGDASVSAVEVVERLQPLVGDPYFRCSDPRLEQIWSAGRRTVSLCSHDAYVDCPTREQRAWVGDAVVHQLVDLATNADWSLARWYPRQAASPRADGMLPMVVGGDAEAMDRVVIADWSLHWVHAVHNLYRYVGDRDEIAALMPVVEGVLRWFDRCAGEDGLPADVPAGVLLDWAAVPTAGVSAGLCGLFGRALVEYAELSGWLGDEGRRRWALERHARLAHGFERLWDRRLQRYSDVLGGETGSQHGQAAAIVGRLAPMDRHARLVDLLTREEGLVHASFAVPDGPALPNSEADGSAYLLSGPPAPWWDVDRELVRAQPFFRYVVHDALVEAGRADLVANACLDWTWSLERCPTTLGETWYGGTTCHGWSATPTRDLVTAVLGVRPAAPGFAAAHLEPALGYLEWAEARCPTPLGMLEIRCDAREVHVTSPVPLRFRDQDLPAGEHHLENVRR